MFTPTILEFSDEIKIGNMSKKITGLLSYVCWKKMFYDCNILHMWQGHFVSIMLYQKNVTLLFYLGNLILKHACVQSFNERIP
jgi:hypothetical protein